MRNRRWNCAQTSGRRPLPQASRSRCACSFGCGRRVDQVAAQLADILEQRAVPAHDVVPEFARGEFLADHDRAAVDQQRAGRDHAAGGVIHRQAIVHAVGGAGVHHAREGVARQHQPVVIDVGGLGQAGGAGRVDVERAILDREPAALRVRQPVAGEARRPRGRCAESWRRPRRAARSWRRW